MLPCAAVRKLPAGADAGRTSGRSVRTLRAIPSMLVVSESPRDFSFACPTNHPALPEQYATGPADLIVANPTLNRITRFAGAAKSPRGFATTVDALGYLPAWEIHPASWRFGPRCLFQGTPLP